MRQFAKLLLFSAALTVAVPAIADTSVRSLKVHGHTADGKEVPDVEMPFVQLPNALIAQKINDRLFLGQFGTMAPKQAGATLEAKDLVLDGMASQHFTVSRQDARVLTIVFENEGCGAYCENYSVVYSFDLKTGRSVGASELVTPFGRNELARRMGREVTRRYREQLASLRAELAQAKRKQDAAGTQVDVDDLNERIELNTRCLSEAMHTDRTPGVPALVDLNSLTFELASQALMLTSERCSNHAMRALDDVGNITLAVPYPTLRGWLAPYGLALLFGEGTAEPPDAIFYQVLKGRIGDKSAITMLLTKSSDNSIRGTYLYDRYRKPIGLTGRMSGDTIELEERVNDSPEPRGRFTLTLAGRRLKGRWTGTNTFDVELAP